MGYRCCIPQVKPLLNQKQQQKRLTWATEKQHWTVAQWLHVIQKSRSENKWALWSTHWECCSLFETYRGFCRPFRTHWEHCSLFGTHWRCCMESGQLWDHWSENLRSQALLDHQIRAYVPNKKHEGT